MTRTNGELHYNRELTFAPIIRNSSNYTKRNRFHSGSQTYHLVPGQFNGFSKKPIVIGDKNGYGTVSGIYNADYVIRDILGIPIHYIHVYRNPYDTIAYLNRFYKSGLGGTTAKVLRRLDCIDKVLYKVGDYLSIRYEDLMLDTSSILNKVLSYLDLPIYKGFIESCRKVLRPGLLHFKQTIDWPIEQITKINNFCSNIEYLRFAIV